MFRYWRHFGLAALAELLWALAASGAEPPAFTVENKTAQRPKPAACPCGPGCVCVPTPGGAACDSYLCPANGGKALPPGTVRTLEGNLVCPDGKGGWRFVEAPKGDSGVIPGTPPSRSGYLVQVCNGNGTCRLVWVPVP